MVTGGGTKHPWIVTQYRYIDAENVAHHVIEHAFSVNFLTLNS